MKSNTAQETTPGGESLERALELMRTCLTPDGYLASSMNNDNYRRIWGRDGVIIGLAALMSEEPELVSGLRRTLITLADHQGPHGEIPSNVDLQSGRISYGGTTGRVDADLWFLIGCGEYWCATGDQAFLEHIMGPVEKVLFLLGAWEFNNRGFLYIPATGDWADEYIHSGYVLYDQLLYLQALRSVRRLRRGATGGGDDDLNDKIDLLERRIRANFWFGSEEEVPADVYHEVLFNKGRKAAERCSCNYWMPFFSPHGYGYRFDGFANVLASLVGVADSARRRTVTSYLEDNAVPDGFALIPAFHPVIKPVDDDWQDLKVTFSYSFKNHPYEFHNGGLWQMITGFHVADLADHGEEEKARRYLEGIHRANSLAMDSEPWAFPEFVHGKKFTPGGNRYQAWSGSAAVMAHFALQGKKVFAINGNDTSLQ